MEKESTKKKKKPLWRRALKWLVWLTAAAVVLIAGFVATLVWVLTPERLTPMAEKMANKMLDADVTIGWVELSGRTTMPFLNLDIDSLVIASRDIRALPPERRDTLPVWADTLVSVGHMHGGVNIFKLITGMVELRDLEITRPQANLLIVDEQINNFSIFRTDTTERDTTVAKIPDIRLNRFALVDPREIRFADLPQGTSLVASITNAELVHSGSESETADLYDPKYRVDFSSVIGSPLLEIIGQQSIPVSLDGIVEWRHDEPYRLRLSDFDFAVSKVGGRVNSAIDFLDRLTFESFDITFNTISITDLLSILPPETAAKYSVPTDIDTDAAISVSGRLLQPYTAGTTDLPMARFDIAVPECSLRWRQVDLRRLQLALGIDLRGGTPNDIRLDIGRLLVAGPATSLELSGCVTDLLTDPLFDGKVDGHVVLDRLPPMLTAKLPGSLKGTVTAHTDIKGRPSMLARDTFHRLQLSGRVDLDDIYYLADDTLSLYSAHKVVATFGTNESNAGREGRRVDSLLTARVEVDSAAILVSGLDIKLKEFSLGVGTQNTGLSADTTAVIPMGGRLKVGSFSLFSLGDTAGVRARGLDGRVVMRRYKGNTHLPLFGLNLGIDRISAGDNHTRFLINGSHLNLRANKLADEELPVRRRDIRRLTDSIQRVHPDIPIDSVYRLAYEIRHRHHHGHRVHPATAPDDNEILYWGTSSALARLLLDWRLEGGLTAKSGGLFTHSFPLRNRVENLNLKFNNDSITLTNVAYKAGHSDFLISGSITNLKRAFTSRYYRSPLKLSFDVESQLIDVNEIANAFFTGSANKDKPIDADLDADHLDKSIEASADSIGPLLIPTNIDAELRMRAAGVEYSDIYLTDFTGTLLLYDGAINLHDLCASSAIGSVNLSALYSAPNPRDMNFGFGMRLNRFNINQFVKMVPAVEKMMPMLHDLSGIIDADVAATSAIDHNMDLVLPTLKAAINISGDSLVIIDKDTYRSIAKWLLFKDKDHNVIDHVDAKMIVEDDRMQVFPFIFDFDRYRLGIQGYNDLDMNLNYHVAVLKSPIPFKFGINVKGDPDHIKIRLGRAHFNEKTAMTRSLDADTTRINLVQQLDGVFRRGVRNSKFAKVDIDATAISAMDIDLDTDTLSAADSLYLRREGLLPE